MTGDLVLTLGLLAATVAMFLRNTPRADAAALLMMTLLPIFGLVSMDDALAGFSDPNILLIAVLFVVGEALVRTGVAQRLGDQISQMGGGSETRILIMLMVSVAVIGAFMSSTGVVALFIPVVLRIAAQSGISAGRLMMPLSIAALISGMMTLVATAPNLVLNSLLERQGLAGFGFFSFTPYGTLVLIGAVGYMLLARRFLGQGAEAVGPARPKMLDWVEQYALQGREQRVEVGPASPWVGKRLDALDLRSGQGVSILGIERSRPLGRRLLQPRPETVIMAGDVLFLDLAPDAWRDLSPAEMDRLTDAFGLTVLPLTGAHFTDQSQDIGMAELLIPPQSTLIGESLRAAAFRSRFGASVLGLRRGGEGIAGGLADQALHAGDILLAAGPWTKLRKLGEAREVILLTLPDEERQVIAKPGRALPVIAIVIAMVVLMVSGWVSTLQAALIAAFALGALGAVDMPNAYRAIHWQSLALILGMLPFSIALQNSGGVALAAEALLALTQGAGPHLALGAVFVLTAVLGLFISNTATAVLVGPVAFELATALGVSPYPLVMGVALAASAAFMTPVSSPVNTLVVGPGGYKFGDFLKIGVPLMIVPFVVTLVLVPILLPF